jgi:diguanylate cyclase (GGDEF)-like protein
MSSDSANSNREKRESTRSTSSGAKGAAKLLLECRKRCQHLEDEVKALQRITEVAGLIAGDLDLDRILDKILDAAVQLTGAERGYLVLQEPDGSLTTRASHQFDTSDVEDTLVAFSKTVVLEAINTGAAVLSTDASEDERFAQAKSVQATNLRAVMAAPIPGVEGKAIGAVYVDDPLYSGRFTRRAMRLLEGLAHQVASAIRTAQLHVAIMREEELYRAATTDPLTRIPNRRWFFERAEDELSFSCRHRIPVSAVMLDIDYFKAVNDTHGHQAGDYVLMTLAGRLWNAKRQEDLLCRYGGEEFLIILRGTVQEDALAFCERFRAETEAAAFGFGGTTINVTVSMGVAALGRGDSLEHLVARADRALYKAKETGRNKVVADASAE